MRPLPLIAALLMFSVLSQDTPLAAQRATVTEPPFTSADKRPAKVVNPVYPADALRAGVEGIVNLEVIVSKDGRVEEAKAMNGPTFLRQAALDAVKQWVWEPFLLNSRPIRVRTRVTLRFDLHNKAASQE
jgi:TonB family protein